MPGRAGTMQSCCWAQLSLAHSSAQLWNSPAWDQLPLTMPSSCMFTASSLLASLLGRAGIPGLPWVGGLLFSGQPGASVEVPLAWPCLSPPPARPPPIHQGRSVAIALLS